MTGTSVKLLILIGIIPIFAFILITGCTHQKSLMKEKAYSDEDINSLLEEITLSEDHFIASVKVSLFKEEESVGVYYGRLLYKDPSRFIIRLHSPFGHTYLEIIFNKGRTYVYSPSKDTVFVGSLPFNTILPEDLNSMDSTIEDTENELKILLYDRERKLRIICKFDRDTMKLNSIFFYPEISEKDRYWIEIKELEGGIPLDFTVHVLDKDINIKLLNIKKTEDILQWRFNIPDAKHYLPLSEFRF
jgi:outer membrane lipoprotein-sorting protein